MTDTSSVTKMTPARVTKILDKHHKWLLGEVGGKRARLEGADLAETNLADANLEGAELKGANLSGAILDRASLKTASLIGVNLTEASLWGADLRGANLDYSCFPLWCGSARMKVSIRLVYQLLAHISVLECPDEPEEYAKIRELILPYARKSHRAKDLKVEEKEIKSGKEMTTLTQLNQAMVDWAELRNSRENKGGLRWRSSGMELCK